MRSVVPSQAALSFLVFLPIVAFGCEGNDAFVDAGNRDAGPRFDAGRGSGIEDASLAPLPKLDASNDGSLQGQLDGGPLDADAGVTPSDAGQDNSPGCVSGTGLSEGEHTFELDGRQRRYILRLPNGYTGARAWPLVLALHGNGGSADDWDGIGGSRDIRSVLVDHAILLIAEAIDGDWRDYQMPSDTWPARIESELVYFEEVIAQATSDLCIDESEIFSMGFSGGGSFSGVLGCRRSDIRAIAVGGSVIYFDEADCIHTPAAWITIGEGELTSGREEYRDFFRDRAGCSAESNATDPSPCVAYDGCMPETPVHYCQHGGGHVWPDFASEAMWAFFQQFVD